MRAYTLVTADGKVMSFGTGDRVDGDLVFLVFTSRDKALEIAERLRESGGLRLEIDEDSPALAVMGVDLRGVELCHGPIGDLPSSGGTETDGGGEG